MNKRDQMVRKSKKRRKMDATSTDNNKTEADNSLEIPGFYYDKETKKYYRILPEHNGIHPLSRKKTNQPRNIREKKEKSKLESILTLMNQLHVGDMHENYFKSKITDARLGSMELKHEYKNSIDSTNDDSCLFLVPWNEKSHLLGVCSQQITNTSKVCAWTVTQKENWSETENPNCKLTINAHEEALWYINGKITEVTLGEFVPNNPCIFICSVQTQTFPITHLVAIPLRSVLCEEDVPHHVEVFKFESNSVWSCTTSKEPGEIVVGMENLLIVLKQSGFITNRFPIAGHKAWGLNTSGGLLYVTTDKGLLLGYDFRTYSARHPAFIVPLGGVPIYQVEPLSNETTLILSGHRNLLQSYDTRARKVVFDYSEHDNEYKRIKASVDEELGVLSTAGQSGVVRLWNLSSGRLLKEIPPVGDGGDFASTWFRGNGGVPAQISVCGNKVCVYQSF